MTRRCSHCSNNGHNSRTCPSRGVKLFGVRLTDGSIRKSASMGNLTHYATAATSSGGTHLNGVAPPHDSPNDTPDHPSSIAAAPDGYASEDFVVASSSTRERKKGVPWTEEEHRMFLLGLQKLGKGDWRGISRNYVISRTPTQVASHAQKYFIRQSNVSRRKRRSSLFDIVSDESVDTPMASRDFISVNSQQTEEIQGFSPIVSRDFLSENSPQTETQDKDVLPIPPPKDEEGESMDSSNSNDMEAVVPKPENLPYSYPALYPAYVAPVFPVAYPFWAGYSVVESGREGTHEVLKPTAVHSKSPINVDELVGISKLSLGETIGDTQQPSSLSLKLVEGSSRQSAFHANPASGSSGMNSSSHNPIHAV